MEPKQLYGFVLLIILVGFVIGVGVLTLDELGDSQTTAATTANETVAFVSQVGTTAFNDVSAVTAPILNGSTRWNQFTFTGAGVITITNATAADHNYNVTYTHQTASVTSAVTDDARDEVALIASSWLGLIITIFVLAIIIAMVMTSFSFRRD